MSGLFAEQFFSPMVAVEAPGDRPVYDEQRSLNLDLGGQVFVERSGSATRTATITEVDAEMEDRDPDDDAVAYLGTETKALGEGTDRATNDVLLGTETRDLAPESSDHVTELLSDPVQGLLGTETLVRAEASDRLDASGWAGTHTAIQNEAEDFRSDGF